MPTTPPPGRRLAAALALALAVATAACGSDDGDVASAPSTDHATATTLDTTGITTAGTTEATTGDTTAGTAPDTTGGSGPGTTDVTGTTTEGTEPDEGTDDLPVTACEDGGRGIDPESQALQFVASLCERSDGDEALRFRVCADDRFPEAFVETEAGERPVFFPQGIIRFHPSDTQDPGAGPGHEPNLSDDERSAAADAGYVVIDDGADHGDFVGDVIESMSGGDVVTLPPSPPAAGEYFVLDDVIALLQRIDPTRTRTIVNMSLGTYRCDDRIEPDDPLVELAETMLRLVEGQRVEHFSVSAGNDETDQISWPAGFGVDTEFGLDDVVTSVGSIVGTEREDLDAARSCFSNHGGWVEAWLPGEEVFVEGRGTWSGTSFAAPQAAALIGAGVDVERAAPPDPPDTFSITWTDPTGAQRPATTSCPPGDGPPGNFEPQLPGVRY
ncbi:S8 family serine peptidase [Ilumatobacter sp.]|uniref:S8 family serine peptidase n=1 Tax=Ilumatobacter sp. TaxID=1967498 RepID=UPI003B52829B